MENQNFLFSKSDFEKALPRNKKNKPLWKYRGFWSGEHIYDIPVKDQVTIRIRSSVGLRNRSHATGNDSIRVRMIDDDNKPLTYSEKKFIQRTEGWELRLTELLRFYYILGKNWEYCTICQKPVHRFKKNSSTVYTCCPDHGDLRYEKPGLGKQVWKKVRAKSRELSKLK